MNLNAPVNIKLPVNATNMTRNFMMNYNKRYRLVAPNIFLDGCEADILGIRQSGFVDEVEIKTSRADFLNDFKKTTQIKNPEWEVGKPGIKKWLNVTKHEALESGSLLPNYFAFFLPTDLIEKCETDIPDYAGLYECRHNSVRVIKPAPRLHGRKITDKKEMHILRKLGWRYFDIICA